MTGFGIGLRAKHYQRFLSERIAVDWLEVISETFMNRGGRLFHILEHVRRDYPIGLHGVSMSLGAATPLNEEYLRQLKELVDRVEPMFVSDHICWSNFGRHYSHDLWPLPFTREVVAHLSERIDRVQNILGRTLMVENVSSYLTFNQSEMSEWDFVSQITKQSGCHVLLDINNVYVSSVNHQFNAHEYITSLPRDSVKQFHLAGHLNRGDYLLDAHSSKVCDDVWQLYEEALRLYGELPTLIEWDEDIPELDVLVNESHAARAHAKVALTKQALIAQDNLLHATA